MSDGKDNVSLSLTTRLVPQSLSLPQLSLVLVPSGRLEQLLAAETSIVALGAARGAPCTPIVEGCSPSPLASSYTTAAAVDFLGAEFVAAASAPSGRHRNSKGKGARVAEVAPGGVVVEEVEVEEEEVAEGVVAGVLAGVVASVAAVGVAVEAVAAEGVAAAVAAVVAVGVAVAAAVAIGAEALALARDSSSSSVPVRLLRFSSFVSGLLSVGRLGHRCFSRLDDTWREEMGEEVERPRWHELLRAGVDIFALNYDAILAAMYALTVSAEGDCYLCVPPDPGVEASALGGPALTRSLPCPAVPSGSLTGLHLPLFSTNLVSNAVLQD
ncbi:unnamed protein product [Closterium sp. NIES-65]|nr:unnamed protein product [Closterium sp. NIES-65]